MTTQAEIKAWIADYRRDFNGLCQALMWQLASRFGTVVSTPPSAISAYYTEKNAGRIKGGDAPAGSFVYFDIGADGHVGFMMEDGRVFMGSTHVDEQWSSWNTGPQSVSDYCAITGAKYLGWSPKNGGNSVPYTVTGGGGGGNYGGCGKRQGNTTGSDMYRSGDSPKAFEFWVPPAATQKEIQKELSERGRYNYPDGTARPADGVWGSYSVQGVQITIDQAGFADLKIDGDAGYYTSLGVQQYAEKFGDYGGCLDAMPAQGSWNGFLLGLQRP